MAYDWMTGEWTPDGGNTTGSELDLIYTDPTDFGLPADWGAGGYYDDTAWSDWLNTISPDMNLDSIMSGTGSIYDYLPKASDGSFDWASLGKSLIPTTLGGTGSNAGLTSAILGAALGGLGGGNSPAGSTTTKTVPWEAQQPYLVDLFNKSSQQLNATNPMLTKAQSNYGSLLNGPTSNPYFGMDNPYLNQSITNAQTDFMRGFQPLMNQANIASGSFGNSGVAQTMGNEAANQLGKISTNMRFQDYYNQQQLGEAAANRTGNATMGASDFSFAPLQQYGSLIRGNYGGNTSTPYFTNTAGNLLGGAMAGSSIYNNLFNKPTTGA